MRNKNRIIYLITIDESLRFKFILKILIKFLNSNNLLETFFFFWRKFGISLRINIFGGLYYEATKGNPATNARNALNI